MARLGKTFNPQDHETEQRNSENLPDGIYLLEAETVDIKENSDEHKTGLNIMYNVIEPEGFSGRKMFDYINIEHPKAQVQKIGEEEFARLCRAIGRSEPVDDTDDLVFKSFTAKVGMGKPSKEKDQNGVPLYPAKNVIKKYFFPDEGDVPNPEVSEAAAGRAANDNARPAPAATNDNAKPATKASGGRVWGKK